MLIRFPYLSPDGDVGARAPGAIPPDVAAAREASVGDLAALMAQQAKDEPVEEVVEAAPADDAEPVAEAEAGDEPVVDKDAKAKEDADLAKKAEDDPFVKEKVAAVERRDRKQKEEHAARVAAVEKREQAVAAQLAEAQTKVAEYERAKGIAKRNPVALLKQLGLTDAEFERVANQVFAASPKASPEWKAKHAADLAAGEAMSEVEQVRAEVAALKAEAQAERDKVALERQKDAFTKSLTAVVTDATAPFLADALASPEADSYREGLLDVAGEMYRATEEMPEPAAVVAEYEKRVRKQAEIFSKRFRTGTTEPPKTTNQNAGEKNAAKTLTNGTGKTTRPPAVPRSREEEIAESVAMMQAGRIDD